MVITNKISTQFLVVATSLTLAISFLLPRTSYFTESPSLFSLAIIFDLTFFLPMLYLAWTRRAGVAAITAIPVFVLAIFIASFLLPSAQQQYLELMKWLLVPVEFFVAGYLISKARRSLQRYRALRVSELDFLETLHATLRETFGRHRAVEILATEICIFYYAFFSWRHKLEISAETSAFTYHKKSGYVSVAFVFAFLIAIETVAMHVLLLRLSAPVAWGLSILSLYGLIFLLADLNAVRQRPLCLERDDLKVRIGLRWRVSIPLTQIKSFEETRRIATDKKGKLLNAVLFGAPNLIIRLQCPMTAIGLYGLKKKFEILALCVDELDQLKKILQERIAESRRSE